MTGHSPGLVFALAFLSAASHSSLEFAVLLAVEAIGTPNLIERSDFGFILAGLGSPLTATTAAAPTGRNFYCNIKDVIMREMGPTSAGLETPCW
jgi:hypothetical protein